MTLRTDVVMATSGQSDPVGLPFFLCRILAFAAACILALIVGVAPAAEEFRGVWVVRHSLTTERSIQEVVSVSKQAGANALLVQVRGRGDAYYRSDLVPRAEGLKAEFDPLEMVLREAGAAGLQVHAWFNVYLAWTPGNTAPLSEQHLLNRYPNWFMRSGDGVEMGQTDLGPIDLVERGVEGRYLSPSLPEVRWHLVDVLEELLTRYDVDGIHLDYVRYPNRHYDYGPSAVTTFVQEYKFDPTALYSTRGRADPGPFGKSRRQRTWERWRADQVTHLVESVRGAIRRKRPDVVLSAAVKPDFVAAYADHGQDWIRWINSGTLDAVMPMFYTGSDSRIASQIREAQKYVRKGALYAGLGIWNQGSESTLAQVDLARRYGLDGLALFSYDTLASNPGLVESLANGPFGAEVDPGRRRGE